MGIRWTKQYDTYSCGPVALMNVLKWRGFSINYRKELGWFREITKCEDDGVLQGTEVPDMNKALKQFNSFIKISFDKKPTIKKIINKLEIGDIIMVCCIFRGSDFAHFFVIHQVSDNRQEFTAINCLPDETVTKLKRPQLVDLMRRRKMVFPVAWYISRKEKEIKKCVT